MLLPITSIMLIYPVTDITADIFTFLLHCVCICNFIMCMRRISYYYIVTKIHNDVLAIFLSRVQRFQPGKIYMATRSTEPMHKTRREAQPCSISHCMMTSSNGNIFRVTGHLCGEFTGPGEFPAQRPVTRSFDVLFDLRLNKRLSKQPRGRWFETPAWSLWRHRNGFALCKLTIWAKIKYNSIILLVKEIQ